jgi:hypothetical protein
MENKFQTLFRKKKITFFQKKMCGRTACTLNPNKYQEYISTRLNQNVEKWINIEDYKPKYNACPTSTL